jgi:hypothetical protein
MWETFSYGMVRTMKQTVIWWVFKIELVQMPYYGISNMEVIEKITREEGGHRLPCPKNCPKEIHQWMLDCWNQDPDSRPSFKELYDRIEKKCKEITQYKQSGESIIMTDSSIAYEA